MHALKHHVLDSVIGTGHENGEDDDDEDGERTETLSLCCCFDGVIGQL